MRVIISVDNNKENMTTKNKITETDLALIKIDMLRMEASDLLRLQKRYKPDSAAHCKGRIRLGDNKFDIKGLRSYIKAIKRNT